MPPFDYPATSHVRKHGPRGYSNADSFRPWLRDEFTFRCVYCLVREQWGRVTGEFDLDHFLAQASHPHRAADYENLIYSCARCNVIKSSEEVPDPLKWLTSENMRLLPDGSLETNSNRAEELVLKLDLNSPQIIAWRLLWLRIVELACDYDPELHERVLGFPDDLPDLSRLRPPRGNARPNGVAGSYFAQQVRGELPRTY